MPNEGVFVNRKISLEEAKTRFEACRIPCGFQGEGKYDFISAIGHQGSAEAFTSLGFNGVEVNRIQARMVPGDCAICLKVIGRIAEGQILTLQKLQEIGFEFYKFNMIANNMNDLEMFACHVGAAPITGRIWNI